MRYSTVPAIDFEAHVARNRELIKALPNPVTYGPRWHQECNGYRYYSCPATYS